jgi:hypothetical protein
VRLVTRIRQVAAPKLNRPIDFGECGFWYVLLVPPGKFRDATLNQAAAALSYVISNSVLTVFQLFDTVYSEILTVSVK